MSQTVVKLGYVPINRGDFSEFPEGTKFYKDNVVQYNGSAFIAKPSEQYNDGNAGTAEEPVYYLTRVPYDDTPNEPNDGWEVFASDSAYCEQFFKYADNPEFVRVYTDAEDKILWGIKADGSIYYGVGVPSQVKEYVDAEVAKATPKSYEQIVSFLDDFIGSDTTLKMLLDGLDGKIVAETVRAMAAEGGLQDAITNEKTRAMAAEGAINEKLNRLNIAIDPERGVLRVGNYMFKLIQYTGDADFNWDVDYTVFVDAVTTIENPEWQKAIVDSEDNVLYGKHYDGTEYEPDLSGYTMTVDEVTASVDSIVNNLK